VGRPQSATAPAKQLIGTAARLVVVEDVDGDDLVGAVFRGDVLEL